VRKKVGEAVQKKELAATVILPIVIFSQEIEMFQNGFF